MKKTNLLVYAFLSISVVALLGAASKQSRTIFLPANVIQPINQSNTIFLWDFHDVIAKRNFKKTFLTVWNSDNKFNIIRKIDRGTLWQLIRLLGKSLISSASSEELVQLAQKNKNAAFETLILDVANVQEPIEGTVRIIQELSKMGYRHYIGSNIGTSIFNDIINPAKYPQFANLFSHFNLDHPQTVSFDFAHPKSLIRKPNAQFYQNFLTQNSIDLHQTTVIFIDDRLENIRAAQQVGMIGIWFKNPEQLNADLASLGII